MHVFETSVDALKGVRVLSVPRGLAQREQVFAFYGMAFRFPDYFGGNWDAFGDCLRDLSWLDWDRIALVHEDVPCALGTRDAQCYLDCLLWAKVFHRGRLRVVFPERISAEIDQEIRQLYRRELGRGCGVEEIVDRVRDGQPESVPVPSFNEWSFIGRERQPGLWEVELFRLSQWQDVFMCDCDPRQPRGLSILTDRVSRREYDIQKDSNELMYGYDRIAGPRVPSGLGGAGTEEGQGNPHVSAFLFDHAVYVRLRGMGLCGLRACDALDFLTLLEHEGIQVLSLAVYADGGAGEAVDIQEAWRVESMQSPNVKRMTDNLACVRRVVARIREQADRRICVFVLDCRQLLLEPRFGVDSVMEANAHVPN